MDELDLRIRSHVYGSFVDTGNAASPAEVASQLGVDESTVVTALRRLHDARALVLEPGSTSIRMLNPFSAEETAHRVEARGRTWYGNCAWDALGIAGALHEDDADVESQCPDCGERLSLEVRGGRLARGAELLFHVLVPARHWWDDIVFT